MEAGHGGPNKRSAFVLLRSLRGRWLAAVAALSMGAMAAASALVLGSSGGKPTGFADVRPLRTGVASHTALRHHHAADHKTPPRLAAGEARLRRLETRMLGAEHAAEHARSRAIARSQSGQATTFSVAAAPPQNPSDVGSWTPKFSIPSVAVHAVMLPTGKVLYFNGPTVGSAHLLDPNAQTTTEVD